MRQRSTPHDFAAHWLGAQRVDFAVCGSTNDEAARLARAGARHGTIVVADAQETGRGRDGRAWASPPGAGLYLSAVVRPPLPIALVPPMTLAIGVGLCDAARAFGADAYLKWPNDALVGDKKLAGVLVESHTQGGKLDAVIVGIGINLTGEPPLSTATTLALASGNPELDRDAVIAQLCAHVELWIDRYVASGIAAIAPAWRMRMAENLTARVTIDGATLVGDVTGLDHDGALLVRDVTGCVHRVRSGDVEPVAAVC